MVGTYRGVSYGTPQPRIVQQETRRPDAGAGRRGGQVPGAAAAATALPRGEGEKKP
jgi:hypothetical protein